MLRSIRSVLLTRAIVFSVFLLGLAGFAAAQPVVSTTVTPNNIGVGGTTNLLIDISNAGEPLARDLSISYTLPSGTEISGAPNTTCAAGAVTAPTATTLEFADTGIAADDTCQIAVPVSPNFASTFTFASVSLVTDLGTSTSNTSDLTVNAVAPTLTHSFSPASVPFGGASTVTYTLDNTANSNNVYAFNFTDTLPPGIVLSSAVPSTTCTNLDIRVNNAANQITWSSLFSPIFEVVGSGGSCTVSFDVTGNAIGTQTNQIETASISSNTSPFNFDIARDNASLVVQPPSTSGPLLTKRYIPATATAGGSVDVEYVVLHRARTGAMTNIRFDDALTAIGGSALTFNSVTTNTCGATVATSGGTSIAVTGGTITTPGDSCTIVANLTAGATAGTFSYAATNVAGEIDGIDTPGNSATADLTITNSVPPSLALTLTDTVSPGDTVFAQFTVTNNDTTSALSDGEFTSDLSLLPVSIGSFPAGNSCGTGSTFFNPDPFLGNFFTATGLTIAAGGSCTFTLELVVDPGASGGPGTVSTSDLVAVIGSTTLSAAGVSDSFTISGGLALEASQVFSGPVVPGGTSTLVTTLTASAENGENLTNIGFTQDLNAALSGLAVTAVGPDTCGGSVSGTSTYTYSGGSIAPGTSCDITLTVTVPFGATDTVATATTSTITAAPASAPTTTLNFPAATGTLSVQSLAFDLEILGGPLVPSGTVTARYTFENNGLANATNGVFTHNWGGAISGLAVESVDSNTCGASPSGTTFLIVTSLTVGGGANCEISVTLRGPTVLPPSDVGTSSSNLSVSLNGSTVFVPAASATIAIAPGGFIASKSFDNSTVTAGGRIQTTLSFDATSATTVTALAFSNDLSAFVPGATLSSIDTNTCGGTSSGTSTISYTGGQIPGGGSCEVAFTVAIPGGTGDGTFTNTTSVISGFVNGVAVNVDPVSAEVRVFGAAAPAIAKSFFPASVDSSGTTTVTYTINNPAGGITLNRLGFSDDIGAAIPGATLSGASTTCSGASVSGTSALSFGNGTLNANSSCTVTATVTLPVMAANTFASATGDLTDNGITVATGTSASLTVTAPLPQISVSIAPGSVPQGGVARVTYAIDNTLSGDVVSNIDISQVLGNLNVAATPNVSNTCGGTPLTGASIGVVGAGIAAGATCAVSIDVTSTSIGAQTPAAPTIGSALGPVFAGSFTLTVTPAPAPAFAQAFTPATIAEGETSTLTYTIDNTSALIEANGLGFTNSLPSGLVVAPTPNIGTTCSGGNVSAAPGSNSISLVGGTAVASASCIVSVDVRALEDGTFNNTSSDLSTSLGTVTASAASLTATPATPPTLTKAFFQSTIERGLTNTVTLTIDNTASAIEATSLSVTDPLPAGIAIADTPNASTTCSGGTLTAASGAGSFSYAGGSVAAGASCTVQVDVVHSQDGAVTNTTGDLTSSLGNSGAASAPVTTTTPPTVTATSSYAPATIRQGETSVYQINITSGATALDTTGIQLNQTFPAGVVAADTPDASSSCPGASVTATAGGSTLSLNGATLTAGASCTVSVRVTSEQIGTFPTLPDALGSDFGPVSGASLPSATLTVQSAPAPIVTGLIAPNSFVEGDTSVLTYTLDNSAAAIPAPVTTLTDTLPANLTIADTPSAATTCGGTLTTSGDALSLSGGEIAAGGTCTVVVGIASTVAANYTNTLDTFDTTTGVQSGVAATSVTVTDAPAPAITVRLAPTTVEQGGTSRLTIGLDNSAALIPADAISLDLLLPASVVLSPTNPDPVTDCGAGTVLPLPTGARLTADSLAAGATCSASVNVVGLGVGGQTVSTANGTSSLGTSANANAVLTVTAADVPRFSKSFSPNSVVQGATSRLQIIIDNSRALVPAEAGSFTDPLPTGLVVASNPGFAANCGVPSGSPAPASLPTLGASSVAGTPSIATGSVGVSGITVAAGDVCIYEIDVQALQPGSITNTTSALTTSLGNSGTAAAVLNVSAAPIPTIAASFTPDSVVQGGTSTLTFTIDNSGALVPAENLGVTLPLPTDMTVAASPNATTTCTVGTLTATAGQSSANYSGGIVAEGSSCEISFDVTSRSLLTSQSVTTSVLETSIGDTVAGATATLALQAAPTPGFSKSFSPASILQGEVSTVTYQIDNSAALLPADGLAFSDQFPNGIVIADAPGVTNTCSAALRATAATDTLSVAGGTVAAGATCEISLRVTSATATTSTSTTGALTSTLGSSGTASADLTVGTGPAPVLSMNFAPDTIPQGDVTRINYVMTNAALVPVTDIAFSNALPAGVEVSGTPSLGNSCGGTATATAGSGAISLLNGALGVGASCTVTALVTSSTPGTATAAFTATSSQGDSVEATANLEVSAAPLPTLAATLTPDTVLEGGVSVLQITLDNATALVDATGAQISLTLPAALEIAPMPNASTTCGSGAITATGGSNSFLLTGSTVSSGGDCTVDVTLRAVLDGTATVAPALTSSLGDSGSTSASLTVTPADTPSFAAGFAPTSISQGLISTLTFDIDNTSQLIEATDASFSAALDSGLFVASPANAATTCGAGTVSATEGGTTIALTAGSVDAGATCSVTVDVTGTTVGTFAANTTTLSTSLGTTSATSASLSITVSPAPGFASSFSPATIPQGTKSRLSFAVDNRGSGLSADSLGFNVNLPAGLTMTGTPAVSSTCGGAVTAAPNGSSITLSGGAVAAGSQCTVSVDVTSVTEGTVSALSGTLTSSLGNTTVAAPSTPLVVVNNPNGSITFIQNSSADGTFAFSSATTELNFAIATSGGTGSFGPVDLPGGTYTVAQSRPDGVGNTSVVCSDGDSVAVASTGTVTIALDPLESLTCTYSSFSSAQETVDQINSFLHRRNNLLLSNGPSSSRRMARLNQGIGQSQTLQFQQGNIGAFNPLNFDLLSIGSGSYSISTSLNELQRSAHMFRLAFDGEEGNSQRWTPNRWDVWFEASYNRFEASQGSDGHFGIAHLGTDYLVNENLLVGLMLSVDTLDDGDDGGATIEGDGWMFGPYITARIAPNLIFDGRLAYGQSSNTISPFGTYEDDFDTDRLLIDATLSGSYDWENWVVTPNLSLSYIEDRAESYTDSLNVVIPGQTVSLGQIRFGPTFSTTMQGDNHAIIEPSFAINGIYNFGDTDGVTIVNDTSNETDGLRARIEAAVRITNRYGTKFEVGANYDGIGAGDFESYGARLQVSIPLQ